MFGLFRRGRRGDDRTYRFEVTRMDGRRPVSSEQVELDAGEATVGRSGDNDIVLASGTVSKRHAQLVLDGDAVTIKDLESGNGTLVNGAQIREPTPIAPGDVIEIGDWRITRV
jgi:pSer/pThr/pTyr-binding forkhead associated (FHA) protein